MPDVLSPAIGRVTGGHTALSVTVEVSVALAESEYIRTAGDRVRQWDVRVPTKRGYDRIEPGYREAIVEAARLVYRWSDHWQRWGWDGDASRVTVRQLMKAGHWSEAAERVAEPYDGAIRHLIDAHRPAYRATLDTSHPLPEDSITGRQMPPRRF